MWVLLPYFQAGTIRYNAAKNRWTQKGGNFFLKAFGQENLGRPDTEIQYGINETRKFLEKQLPGTELPEIRAALLFFNEKTELAVEGAPYPAIKADKAKDFFRKRVKDMGIAPDLLAKILAVLPPGE